MCPQPFRGVYPATLTPYTPDGKLNGPLLCELVETHLATGVDGFYIGGGTGEGILQTVDERIESVRLVMAQVSGRAQVIAHVGAVTTSDAVRLAREVAALGVDAVSALPPIFYRVPLDSVLKFYREIAAAAAKPMLAYYIPGLNGITFTRDDFDQLFAIEHVVGVKFSHGDLFLLQQLVERHPDAVVMSGNDEILLSALAAGAHGSIGLTLNIMPTLYVQLYQAFANGDITTAQALQAKANRLIQLLLTYGSGGIGGLKPLMKMIGFDCGVARPPLPDLDQAACRRLREQLTEIGFFSDPIYVAWSQGR